MEIYSQEYSAGTAGVGLRARKTVWQGGFVIYIHLNAITPLRLRERRPQTSSSTKSVEVTFREWHLDIRSDRLDCSERWSSGVIFSRAGTSEDIEVIETFFGDYKTAWIAGLKAGLERVDRLHGGVCENSMVMIHNVNRVWYRKLNDLLGPTSTTGQLPAG
jgi:hypothetical protein